MSEGVTGRRSRVGSRDVWFGRWLRRSVWLDEIEEAGCQCQKAGWGSTRRWLPLTNTKPMFIMNTRRFPQQRSQLEHWNKHFRGKQW